ncbi:MAG: hypothetical protein KME18_21890 [Phormidium tanganyikae FI6-MK23]|nr:hypothetical protein [Phormidium tanganyikae FI6-MK23]
MSPQVVTPVLMIEPSSWLRSGITIENVDQVNLVKFTPELQTGLEDLLGKHKSGSLNFRGRS